MSQEKQSGSRAVEWWREVDLKGQVNARVGRRTQVRSRVQVWLVRVSTSILLWACVIQLIALWQLWQPRLLRAWPPCFDNDSLTSSHSSSAYVPSVASLASASDTNNALLLLPSENVTKRVPLRKYRNNGYLLVSCNGGLNQMRAGICDMVAVARLLNLTLIIPELDKTSFWADPSDFGDIFDVDYFINSLRSEVRILNELPAKYQEKVRQNATVSMPPISWSNESYYLKQVLPLFRKHKVLHFSKTDSRLANSGLPLYLQKLRCHVNYNTLRFTSQIEELGRKLIKILRENGPFLVLHLRYEMDMLSFSGCTHGCTEAEADELTRLRYANTWWKEKDIDSEQRRSDGLCPLTPEETMLVLKALGFAKDIQIYIAAGEIYGGDKRMSILNEAYPNIVRKEMLLSPKDLRPFQNHSSQMAALDYLVAIESDIFIPTYDGNMAKVVEGHRRYLDFRRTILLDRQRLVVLVDQYQNGTLQWDEFALAVGQAHETRMGAPTKRRSIPDRPKEEDYFYANPEECLS